MRHPHPWLLVAPWYRWQRQADDDGRSRAETVPVLQAYDTSDHVTAFLANPQRALKFGPEDEVYVLGEPLPPELVASGPLSGRTKRLSATTLLPTGIRKVFLPIHKRFYLVVCELHCDAPGLPNAARDDVCEAGLVVRRRRLEYPDAERRDAYRLLRRLVASTAVERAARTKVGVAGPGGVFQPLRLSPAPTREQAGAFAQAQATLKQDRLELVHWAERIGAVARLEGWVPDPEGRKGIGAWQEVEEEPQDLAEEIFPLYPLVPDPTVESHAGAGRSLYFGLLPTGSADTDAAGGARFDDRHPYEVRCFVRRHKEHCPRTLARNDCHGRLFWSRPTEPYHLASPTDLHGTSNQAVTIPMPDLPMLMAQAAALPGGPPLEGGGTAPPPRGGGAPVKVVSPPGSALEFKLKNMLPDKASASIKGPPSVCSFSIPLITMIAMFVLNIFLPIFMLIFGLWILLKLKFCIPPTIELSAGLATQLKLAADLNVDLDATVAASADVQAQLPALSLGNPLGVQATLTADFDAGLGAGMGAGLAADPPGPEPAFSNTALADFHVGLDETQTQDEEPEVGLTAGVEWEEEVTV